MYRPIILALLILIPGCGVHRAIYVEHAALENPSLYKNMNKELQEKKAENGKTNFPVMGHRIVPGEGTVIAYRAWSPGSIFVIDDEHYEKVTIYMSGSLLGNAEINIEDNPNIIVLYVSGGSAWPKHGCYGTSTNGFLRYNPTLFGGMEAEISFRANLTNAFSGDPCEQIMFHKKFKIEKKLLTDLSPWEGRPSSRIIQETYP